MGFRWCDSGVLKVIFLVAEQSLLMEQIVVGRIYFSLYQVLSNSGAMATLLLETLSTDSSGPLMTNFLWALSRRKTGKGPSEIGASLFRVSLFCIYVLR